MARQGAGLAWGGGRLYFTHGYTQLTEYSEDFSTYRVLGTDWGDAPGQFKGAGAIWAEGPALYALDRENDRIQLFDDGLPEASLALPEPGANGPSWMAVDKQRGYIYVLDRPWNDSSRVLRLSLSSGALLDQWSPGFGLSGGILAVDPAGDICVHYWGQTLLHRIRPSLTPGGAWLAVSDFLPYGDGEGAARGVNSLCITPDGRYVVCDGVRQQLIILKP
jgi:hypothetical protein